MRKRLSFLVLLTANFKQRKIAFPLVTLSIAFVLCLSNNIFAQDITRGRLEITEEDSNPSTFPYKLKVPNSSLTDNADGTASLLAVVTESDPLALLTAGTDNVKDTHIDWGTGASQVSADDIPDGSTNAIITLTQETNFGTAYTHSQDNTQAHSDYLLNSESDTMTGTLTADGFTMGNDELITFGSETFAFVTAGSVNDFQLTDDLNILDTDPHLKLVPTVGDAFEMYAFGNEWYFTNVTDSKVLWKATTGNLINFYNQAGFNFPDVAPTDNYILKYDAALGRMAWEADATGAGYTIYIEEGDVAKADNTAANLYVDFDATDFETAVVGNEVNVTIPDDGHLHTGASLSSIDISLDTNLAGDTEIVLTGDALSIAAGITRDTEWDTSAEIQAIIGAGVYEPAGVAVADITDASANGRSLISAANYAAMRGLLDLEAGTDFYSMTAADTAFEAELDNSAGLLAALSDETGTGLAVFSTSPTFTTQITTPIIALTGGQIAFPATQAASAGANTLDDYEEGTWTATFTCGTSGTVTINIDYNTGAYVKIGRMVMLTGMFRVTSVSSPVGELLLNGIPFVPGSTVVFRAGVSIFATGLVNTAATAVMGRITPSNSYIGLFRFAAGATTGLSPDMQADADIYVSATYFTD